MIWETADLVAIITDHPHSLFQDTEPKAPGDIPKTYKKILSASGKHDFLAIYAD
jgi:hypothetical protein